MQRLVYLGWPLFRIINRWFTIYVFDFLTGLNINMGIVLILITLLLKLITYPMVKKSYMSSAKMRVLKPKLEEATKHLNKPGGILQVRRVASLRLSADAHTDAYLDCNVQLRAERHPAPRRELPLDKGPLYV